VGPDGGRQTLEAGFPPVHAPEQQSAPPLQDSSTLAKLHGVGSLVGAGVGAGDGELVGKGVGGLVGLAVVGELVGGGTVGEIVGKGVGELVGLPVVGELVGVAVVGGVVGGAVVGGLVITPTLTVMSAYPGDIDVLIAFTVNVNSPTPSKSGIE